MIEIARNTRQRDAIRIAHEERSKMLMNLFRVFRRDTRHEAADR